VDFFWLLVLAGLGLVVLLIRVVFLKKPQETVAKKREPQRQQPAQVRAQQATSESLQQLLVSAQAWPEESGQPTIMLVQNLASGGLYDVHITPRESGFVSMSIDGNVYNVIVEAGEGKLELPEHIATQGGHDITNIRVVLKLDGVACVTSLPASKVPRHFSL
jgi:hypothetical protein